MLDTAITSLRVAVEGPERRITAAHLAEFQAKYPLLLLDGRAKKLADAVVATGKGLLVYHTFEGYQPLVCPPQAVRPAGMLSEDPRRFWHTPFATNVPVQKPLINTPPKEGDELLLGKVQLNFVVDIAGVVSVVAGSKVELTTVVGLPADELVLSLP